MSLNLNPAKALIFRIVHVSNVPWILDNGLYCRNAGRLDPNFIDIGSAELISKRHTRRVELAPGGTLSDYVPFYFTPYSMMMFNIHTGHGGIPQRRNEEIVIMVSSLHRLKKLGVGFLFTDQHAYPVNARYFSDLNDLNQIDWQILQSRDFKHDPEDPGKKERYQAEALVHGHVPVEALLGIVGYDIPSKEAVERDLASRGITLRVLAQPHWYF
jgi:hypothetical protein